MATELYAAFDQEDLDPRLQWMNPPADWSVDVDETVLVVKPAGETDFWQRTHYGFRADSGSFLYVPLAEDFVMTTRVEVQPRHQYDQAGLMVRVSADCWIKTSVEHETETPSVVGAVVTNSGYSDWSTQEFVGEKVDFQIVRRGADYIVHWRETDQRWRQLRLCHLHQDYGSTSVLGGLYACCPKQAGMTAKFEFLSVDPAAK